MNDKQQFEELAKPFLFDEVELKPQALTRSKDKALCVPYIRASAARARLNAIFNPWNWNAEYREILAGKGGIICRLTVTTAEGHTVVREGMAGFSDIEAVKGGESDSFKRAFAALGNDSMQKAELGWHPIKTWGEGDKAKFDSWANEAEIRKAYEKSMGIGKAPAAAKPAPQPAAQTPAQALSTNDKVKALALKTPDVLWLKDVLKADGPTFQAWAAAQYDGGARTFEDLKRAAESDADR